MRATAPIARECDRAGSGAHQSCPLSSDFIGVSTSQERVSAVGLLSRREREVLVLLAEGHSLPEIARLIHRSLSTIKSHRQAIADKLGVRNRIGMARLAEAAGLLRTLQPLGTGEEKAPWLASRIDSERWDTGSGETQPEDWNALDRAAAAAGRSATRLVAVAFEHSPVAMIITDLAGVVSVANAKAREHLTLAVGGAHLADCAGTLHPSQVDECIRSILSARGPVSLTVIRDATHPLESLVLTGFPVPGASGAGLESLLWIVRRATPGVSAESAPAPAWSGGGARLA
jgi:DNA-binding CsgD family transcriptional regulator